MSAYATRLSSSGRRSSQRLAKPSSAWRWLAELPTSCPFIGRCLKFAIHATFRLEAPPPPIHIACCRCGLRKVNAKWFNPTRPATVDPKADWLVQILRSTFRKRRVSASGETGRLWRLARRRYEVCRLGTTLCEISLRSAASLLGWQWNGRQPATDILTLYRNGKNQRRWLESSGV